MADFEELSFVIPGYTPETIPLGRLIEYLQQVSALLGDQENLHLIEVRQGSAEPVFRVSTEVALEAKDKAAKVQRGDGTRKQVDAYNRLRRMVRRDSRDVGVPKPAVLRTTLRTVLEIPAAPDDLGVLSGIRQATSIDGQLIRVGGAGDDATMQIQDLSGKILSNFTAKRTIAKELGNLLWENVRFYGIGQWGRDSEGIWGLEKMQVQSYERLDDEDLGVTVERLRDLKVAWPADAYDKLLLEREGQE